MKIQKYTLILGLALVRSASFGSTLWYNGDFDQRNGINVSSANGYQTEVYDDFNVGAGGWSVTDVFLNVLSADSTSQLTSMSWEIRQGVGTGTGGTLIASGSGTPTVTETGRNGFALVECTVDISGLNLHLAPGTYFLGGSVLGIDDTVYLSTTSGANSVGSPGGNNGNSFWNSSTFGESWVPTTTALGAGTWDFSMGVKGPAAPEPESLAVLGFGLVGLFAHRRRSRT